MSDENCTPTVIDALSIQTIRERINQYLKDQQNENNPTTTEIQLEIGKLANLLGEIEQLALTKQWRELPKWKELIDNFFHGNPLHKNEVIQIHQNQLYSMIKDVDLAVNAVLAKPSKEHISKKIRRRLEYELRYKKNFISAIAINLFKQFLHASTSPGKVILGLLFSLPIYILIPLVCVNNVEFIANKIYFLSKKTQNYQEEKTEFTEFKENIALTILAGSAGALGSFISIITRIKQYDSKEYEDAVLPIIIGALKPVIGASFAILFVALISSNTLPLKVDEKTPGSKQYFYYSIAFIIGFSERFARDIVSRAERAIIGIETDYEESNTKPHT